MIQETPEQMQVKWQEIAARLRHLIDKTLIEVEATIVRADPDEVATPEYLRTLAEAGWHVYCLETNAANMASRITREGGYQQ